MAKAPSEAIVGREATEMTEEIAVNGTTGTIATTEGIEMTATTEIATTATAETRSFQNQKSTGLTSIVGANGKGHRGAARGTCSFVLQITTT